MTKKHQRKHLNWSWTRSEHLWLVIGGLIFTLVLVVGHEQWGGIASITCFSLSLGLRIIDRMPGPTPTVKPTVKLYQ